MSRIKARGLHPLSVADVEVARMERPVEEKPIEQNATIREDTFPKLLIRNAHLFGSRPSMRHKDLGIWQTWTWSEALEILRAYAAGLHRLGLKRGDTIAIVGTNRPKLYWSVMAAQMLGAIPVPVYADAVADEIAFVLAHAEARFAVVEDQEQVDKILSVMERLPKLERMLYDEKRGLRHFDHSRLHDVENVIASGRQALRQDASLSAWLDAEIESGRGSDPSIILYTSGTTGSSKGVVFTSERSIAAAKDTIAFDKLTEYEVALAYLPLAWVGDHYLNYVQGLVSGFCMACPESPDTVMADLREIGPTFYFAPPRTLEALLTRVMIRMEDAGFLKRKMFHYFIGVARRYGEPILNKKPVPLRGRLLYAIGNALVYGPLKNVLGFSRVRVAYTAGEAIGPDLFAFYRSIGLNLKQLYGQTEAFLYLTAHRDSEIYADTVGPSFPNVKLRIAESGEVLFKSPGMFTGYFKDADKTAEAFTADGYVKSGDAGYFDERTSHLKIIDRAKDVGKLNDGTLFSPKYIENKLKFYPNIREAVAYGSGRDFVAVMINIDLTAVGSWAERNNVTYASYQELAGHPRVYEMIEKHVAEVNRAFAADTSMAGAQIRRFLILHKELDADDGELTRTQKVRRGFIAEHYAPLVRALYDGSREADIATEVNFEDGHKGTIEARVKIHDLAAEPAARTVERAA